MDADTALFGSEDATPGSRACVRVRAPLGRVGRAGLPGTFWCASPFLWPVLVRSLLIRPPTGWGCPVCDCCWIFFSIPVAPPLSPAFRVLGPGVCVPGLGFRRRPATPGWGVGVCVCLCARSACTPPLLAGVWRVVVSVWARVSAAPRHSRLGRWGVCVFVCVLCLYPATPGWGVRCGCVCLGLRFGCAPPIPAGLLGCVCVCGRAPPVPCHSWLGCAVWVCVPGLGLRLRPATPGWGVGVCVCLWARLAFTPPLLAGVCSVGVCAWARVLAALRHC